MNDLSERIEGMLGRPDVQFKITLAVSIGLGICVLYSIYGTYVDYTTGTTFMGDPYTIGITPILAIIDILLTMIMVVFWLAAVALAIAIPTIPFLMLHNLRKGTKPAK